MSTLSNNTQPQTQSTNAGVKGDRVRAIALMPSIPFESALVMFFSLLSALAYLALKPGRPFLFWYKEDGDTFDVIEISSPTIFLIRTSVVIMTAFADILYAYMSPRLKTVVNDTWLDSIITMSHLALCVSLYLMYTVPWDSSAVILNSTMLLLVGILRLFVSKSFEFATVVAVPPSNLKKVGSVEVFQVDGTEAYTICVQATSGSTMPPLETLISTAKRQEMSVKGSNMRACATTPELLNFFLGDTLIGHGCIVSANGSHYVMTAAHVALHATRVGSSVNPRTSLDWSAPERWGAEEYDPAWDTYLLRVNPNDLARFSVRSYDLVPPDSRRPVTVYANTEDGWMSSKGGIRWDRKYGALHTASTQPGFSGTPLCVNRVGGFEVVGVHLGAEPLYPDGANRFSPVGFRSYADLSDRIPREESAGFYLRDVETVNEFEAQDTDYAYSVGDDDYVVVDRKVKRVRGRRIGSRRFQPEEGEARNLNGVSRMAGPAQTNLAAVRTTNSPPQVQPAPTAAPLEAAPQPEVVQPATTVVNPPPLAPSSGPASPPTQPIPPQDPPVKRTRAEKRRAKKAAKKTAVGRETRQDQTDGERNVTSRQPTQSRATQTKSTPPATAKQVTSKQNPIQTSTPQTMRSPKAGTSASTGASVSRDRPLPDATSKTPSSGVQSQRTQTTPVATNSLTMEEMSVLMRLIRQNLPQAGRSLAV